MPTRMAVALVPVICLPSCLLCPAVVSPGRYDEVQRRGLKPGWNPVETACGGYASPSPGSLVRAVRVALTFSAREVARLSS